PRPRDVHRFAIEQSHRFLSSPFARNSKRNRSSAPAVHGLSGINPVSRGPSLVNEASCASPPQADPFTAARPRPSRAPETQTRSSFPRPYGPSASPRRLQDAVVGVLLISHAS